MGLREVIKRRYQLADELSQLDSDYKSKKTKLISNINKCIEEEKMLSENLDTDKIKLANSVMYIDGNILRENDNYAHLDEMAMKDISLGTPKLRKEYFGIKRYSGYVQEVECEYYSCPTYGSIIAEVGLREGVRDRDLTEEEADACIYLLKNFKKIYEIKKEML